MLLLSIIAVAILTIAAVVVIGPKESGAAGAKSPSQSISLVVDAANRYDAAGLINCTILRFEEGPDFANDVHVYDQIPWFRSVSFIAGSVEVLSKDDMDVVDRALADSDISSKQNELGISISDYCSLTFSLTRICNNPSLSPVLGASRELSGSVLAYKVGQLWYLARLPSLY